MNHIRRKTIYVIDAYPSQSRTYANQLRFTLPDFKVEEMHPPEKQMSDYLPLLARCDIACLMVEQRLKDTGIAMHDGLELAQFLRSQGSQIPFFILTNFVWRKL